MSLPIRHCCNGPWIEVSLDNVSHNLDTIRTAMPKGSGVIAVVKDSAYGCGAIPIARLLERRGVKTFAVARIGEARALREAGIMSTILVLGDVAPDDLAWAAANQVQLTANGVESVSLWAEADLPLPFHCNIDTGMGRLGVRPDELPRLLDLTANTPLRLTGVFTHLACADDPPGPGPDRVAGQLALFDSCVRVLHEHGVKPAFVHCGNSAGVLNTPWPPLATHARPGIALYGCLPDPNRPIEADLRPVASLRGCVVKLKRIRAGTPVSYGWQYTAPHDTTIATVNIGYGHGLPRRLGEGGAMLVGGKRYPIVGRVTMDFTMLDIGTAPNVRAGDEVVAIGSQGTESISPDDVARMSGTIAYEILCGLSTRVERRYVAGGVVVERRDALHC